MDTLIPADNTRTLVPQAAVGLIFLPLRWYT